MREHVGRAGPGEPFPPSLIHSLSEGDIVPAGRAGAAPGRSARVRTWPIWDPGPSRVPTLPGVPHNLIWLNVKPGGERTSASLPDVERALIHPAAVFASPDEVVRHPRLTIDCKREILTRWAWDEYLGELAAAEGMPEGAPSRLQEVKAALRIVTSERGPGPAAPAAFPTHYEIVDLSRAA